VATEPPGPITGTGHSKEPLRTGGNPGSPVPTSRRPDVVPASTGEPTAAPRPLSTFTLVGMLPDGQDGAVGGAEIQIGNYRATSDNSGLVKVMATSVPTPNTIVQIAHKDIVTRFARFDGVSREAVRLERKMRVVTVTPRPGDLRASVDVEQLQS